jgi:hypothetical protein
MPSGKCWWCAEGSSSPTPEYQRALISLHVGQTGWTSPRVRQAGFVGLLVSFHFFFLLLPVCSLGEFRLVFIAVQKRSPCRVRSGLTILEFFVGGAFRLSHSLNLFRTCGGKMRLRRFIQTIRHSSTVQKTGNSHSESVRYLSSGASLAIRAAAWLKPSECFSLTCVRNILESISLVSGCVFCVSVTTFSTQMISWHSEHLPKR